MLLQIYNPSPVPWNDLEANLVNNLGIISGSIPLPVSLIVIIAYCCLSHISFFKLTYIESFIDVNLNALSNILVITWEILDLSASVKNEAYSSFKSSFEDII